MKIGRAENARRHQLKDPARLTPYEERLWACAQKKMTCEQMREALASKASDAALKSRLHVIKEKIELQGV